WTNPNCRRFRLHCRNLRSNRNELWRQAAIRILMREQVNPSPGPQEVAAYYFDSRNRNARRNIDSALAAMIAHVDHMAVGDAGHLLDIAVGHGSFWRVAPGIMALADAAHRFGKDVDFFCLKLAVI